MEYNVVFEVTEISKIHYYSAVGVFGGLFIVAISVLVGTIGTASHMNIWKPLISLLFATVFLYFTVHLCVDTTKMVNEIYGSYERGEVQIAEGLVENCDTAFFYQNGRGSFEVDHIEFNYGHTTGIPGYRGKDNLIHTNGQQVRIQYISYRGQNIIVKIEISD